MSPWLSFTKSYGFKSPRDLYNLAKKQVSSKQRTQKTMVTKDCTTNLGLTRLPNTAHKPIMCRNGDISKELAATFKKTMHTVLKQNIVD